MKAVLMRMAELFEKDKLKDKIVSDIRKGKVFIYPTDTVYGLGCNALKKESVDRIRKIKGLEKGKPLSVIAPSKAWIVLNTIIDMESLNRLPGPYTFIVAKKRTGFLKDAAPGFSLGIRMPLNPFSGLVTEAGIPFITTSANITGERPPSRIEDINPLLMDKADYVIDGGKTGKRPSTIIDVTGAVERIVRK